MLRKCGAEQQAPDAHGGQDAVVGDAECEGGFLRVGILHAGVEGGAGVKGGGEHGDWQREWMGGGG